MELLKPPKASSEAIKRSMQGNRSKGTVPELLLTSMIRGAGIRGYRKNDKRFPGKPDIYLPSIRLAIFLNGCFWHRCPYCKPAIPSANREFWTEKFENNRERDTRQKRERDKLGIRTLVVWECQLKKNPEGVMVRILKKINEWWELHGRVRSK
jgi:DNA mismatch endonuclease (patch repair protein)